MCLPKSTDITPPPAGNDIGFTPPENPAPAGAIDPPESVNRSDFHIVCV